MPSQELKELTSDELADLRSELETTLSNEHKDSPAIERVISTLIDKLNAAQLCDISENSPLLRGFFQTHETMLQQKFAPLLRSNGYPDKKIISIDKQETCSFFSELTSANCWMRYLTYIHTHDKKLTEDARKLINKAADMGEYHALAKRIEINLSLLKTIKVRSSQIEEEVMRDIKKDIKQDASRIANLYWSPGCVYAGFALLEMANLLDKPSKQISAKKTAADYFHLAKLIEDAPLSKDLTEVLHQGKGLFFIFPNETYSVKTWDDIDHCLSLSDVDLKAAKANAQLKFDTCYPNGMASVNELLRIS